MKSVSDLVQEQKKLEEKEAAERERLFKQAPTNKIQQKAPPGTIQFFVVDFLALL